MPIPRTQEDHHKAELRVQEQEVKVSLQLYSCAKHGTRYMVLSPLYSSQILLLSPPLFPAARSFIPQMNAHNTGSGRTPAGHPPFYPYGITEGGYMPHRPRSEEEKKSGDDSGGVLPGNPKTEEERKQHTRPGTSHPTQKPGPWGDGFDWDSHFGNKDPSTNGIEKKRRGKLHVIEIRRRIHSCCVSLIVSSVANIILRFENVYSVLHPNVFSSLLLPHIRLFFAPGGPHAHGGGGSAPSPGDPEGGGWNKGEEHTKWLATGDGHAQGEYVDEKEGRVIRL